jgi:hypothetical protein
MMSGYQGFGNATPFSSALQQGRDIAGSLKGTGMTGAFTLENRRLDNENRLAVQGLANENALAQIDLTGQWNRRIGKDVIEANRATSRRAGLLGLLAGGSGLLGGGGGEGGGFRPAGAGLSGTPWDNLTGTLTGFNNVNALMNESFDLGVGTWGQGGRTAVTRGLGSMPRPPALS